MGSRTRLITCLVLVGAVVQAMAFAEVRADETWSWTPASGNEPAKAQIAAGGQADVALAMTFPPARGCYTAELMLTDSAGQVLPSRRVTVMADGEAFALAASPVAGVYEAPPPVFRALKRARSLRVATAEAEYLFSPAGSAAAINAVWKACEAAVEAAEAKDSNTAAPEEPTGGIAGDAMDGDAIDERGDAAPGERPASKASIRRRVLPLVVLLFAIGNAVLILSAIAKTLSLPAVSPPAGGHWRRGAALAGAIGWITLPPIAYVAYGLGGALLAMASYLAAGLLIAALVKPRVIQYAAARFVERLHALGSRGNGDRRGARLIVAGYRDVARRRGVAPTAQTTDADILHLFERVGSAFKFVADQRGEHLSAPRTHYIVWQFLQAHEALDDDTFDAYLQQELARYRTEGLPAAYRKELRF
jgi:hypothetical protein